MSPRKVSFIVKAVCIATLALSSALLLFCLRFGQGQQRTAEGHRPADEQQQATQPVPSGVPSPHAGQAGDGRQQNQSDANEWSDPMVLLTLLLVIAAIAAGAIYWDQLRQMQRTVTLASRQLDFMEEQAGLMRESLGVTRNMVSQNERLVRSAEMQADAAREQAGITLRQFEVADRPWLDVAVVPDGPLVFDSKGTNLHVRFHVKNVGHSVATGATVNVKTFLQRWEGELFRDAIEEQKKVCGNVRSPIMAYAIFPEREHIWRIGFGIGMEEMESARIGPTNYIALLILGCVDYQFSGQTAHHQTGFIYEVHARSPESPDGGLLIEIGKDIPADRLVFRKTIVGGDYAT